MDGSNYGGRLTLDPEPLRSGGDPPPDREWALSAGQVTAIVLAILAACELIGWLT